MRTIFGLAKTSDQARKIIQDLRNEGFRAESISFLAYDRENVLTKKNARGELELNKEIGHEKNSKAPEGAAIGGTAGGIIGGAIGLLAGIGALAIPGVGPFIAAGPIMAALAGSAVGGSVGMLTGSLIGLGLPEYEAKKFEKGLREGHILLSIEAEDSKRGDRAKEILEKDGAVDISRIDTSASHR